MIKELRAPFFIHEINGFSSFGITEIYVLVFVLIIYTGRSTVFKIKRYASH